MAKQPKKASIHRRLKLMARFRPTAEPILIKLHKETIEFDAFQGVAAQRKRRFQAFFDRKRPKSTKLHRKPSRNELLSL